MIPFDLFNGNMGMSLFGAPKMFDDMPEPGMPQTGAPDGVSAPTSLLADMPAAGASPTGLGGADKDFFVPPGSEGAKPPPAGPPMPVPQPSLKPIPPSAASQLPPPLTGPGSDKATAATPGPTLPLATQGGIGPDPPVAAAPATTGSTTAPAAAAGGTNPDGTPKKGGFQDFLEQMGQLDTSGLGGKGEAPKPANIGSAGQPHIPQGASQLFQQILDSHQKAMPMPAKVPDMSAIMQRLGLRR